MAHPFPLRVDAARPLHPVSERLFGIFLEDINFACDGGLNANLVNNWSFDGVYVTPGPEIPGAFGPRPSAVEVVDRLRYWVLGSTCGTTPGAVPPASIESRHDDPVAENSWYARVTVGESTRGTAAVLENLGYNGDKLNPRACAMSIVAGQTYSFSCWLRGAFQGTLTVSVTDADGVSLSNSAPLVVGETWQQASLTLTGAGTGYGKLVLRLNGQGTIDLDGVSLMSTDTWQAQDPRWSQGLLRRDLVEALRDLKPRFLRFPGGCIVEGYAPGNEYDWKDTVGPLINRRANYNLWGMEMASGGYSQSYQVGFYEYFLLCEDLGMEPLPTLFAGLNCQVRSQESIATGSDAFRDYVVQNYLDLIAYANGDPAASPWAALRAEAGHPAPFGLKLIGIGNENFGEDYLAKFAVIKEAVEAASPGITCVLASGLMPRGEHLEQIWAAARERHPDVLVDEHSYAPPEWYIEGAHRYDDYIRGGPRVYMGEYAANAHWRPIRANCYRTALAEAAFLTGLERNSDVVAMSSYAPLLSLAEGNQWHHNLIVFNPGHVLLTANYFVQQLFSTTVGEQVVAVDGDLREGVFASATATDEQLILKLVNTSAASAPAVLSLPGIPDGEAAVTVLQCDDLDAANALAYLGEPIYAIQPQSMSLPVRDGTVTINLAPYGIYALQVGR